MRVVFVLVLALLATPASADTVTNENELRLPGLRGTVDLGGYRVARHAVQGPLTLMSISRDANTGILLMHAYQQSCDYVDDVFIKMYPDAQRQPAVYSWMPTQLERMRTSPRVVMACMELRVAALAIAVVTTADLEMSDSNDVGFAAPLAKIVAAYASRDERDAVEHGEYVKALAERAHAQFEYDNRGDTTTQFMIGGGFGYNLNLEDAVNYGLHLAIDARLVPNRGFDVWAQTNFVLGGGEGDFAVYTELAGQVGYGFATKYFLAAPLVGAAATRLGPSGPLELMIGGVAEVRNGRNELTFRVQGLKCLGAMGIEHDEVSATFSYRMLYVGVRRLWWDDEPADAVMLPGDNFLPDRGAWYTTVGFGATLD